MGRISSWDSSTTALQCQKRLRICPSLWPFGIGSTATYCLRSSPLWLWEGTCHVLVLFFVPFFGLLILHTVKIKFKYYPPGVKFIPFLGPLAFQPPTPVQCLSPDDPEFHKAFVQNRTQAHTVLSWAQPFLPECMSFCLQTPPAWSLSSYTGFTTGAFSVADSGAFLVFQAYPLFPGLLPFPQHPGSSDSSQVKLIL